MDQLINQSINQSLCAIVYICISLECLAELAELARWLTLYSDTYVEYNTEWVTEWVSEWLIGDNHSIIH